MFNKTFDVSTNVYMVFTRMLARKIIIGLIIVIGLSVAMGFVGKRIPGGFMPEEDMGYLFVNIQLPDAASLQRSDAVAKKLEKMIAQHDEVAFVTAAAGYSLLSNAMIPNSGFSVHIAERLGRAGADRPAGGGQAEP